MFYEDGCQLLYEVSTDSGYMPLLTSETAREFAIIIRPLYTLQTLLFGFRMMAFGELAAQSGYLSLMFTNSSGIMDSNSIRESHGFVKSEVDAYGSVLAFFRSMRMSSMVFFFGNLNLNGNEKLVSVLQNLRTQYLTNETQALGHLYVTEVWDVNILVFVVNIVCRISQMLQSFVGIRELNLLSRADIKGAIAISLFVHCGVFGTMGKEIIESSLKVIESMSGGIFCHFVCPWEFFATDSIEVVSQLASGQALLALLVASLPFRQAPIIGKAATAYGLTEVSPLLVVRHELNTMGECNHVLFLNVVLYGFLNILQQLLVFVTTVSIKTGGKYGNDFKDVLGKFLLKLNVLITFVDDYDFYVFSFANGKDQFGSEPKQTILVCQHKSSDFTTEYHVEQPFETFLVVAHTTANVLYDFVSVSFTCAVSLQYRNLAHQIFLLVVRRHAGVGNSFQLVNMNCGILIKVAERVKTITPVATTSTLVGMKHSVLIPIAHRGSSNAKSFGSFAYRKQFLHDCKCSKVC